jgi:hypothetical protein
MISAHRMTRAVLACTALAAGCGDSLPGPCEDGSCGTQVSVKKTFQIGVNRRLDVLFVIDDTSAMAPHADALAAGMTATANRILENAPKVSLHVGFVRAGTCDASTRGAACGVGAPEQFLRSEWCNTISNYEGGWVDASACLADFGTTNCGPAQPLATTVAALAGPPRAGWEAFLRPDAYLMVVIVAAADDASGPTGSPTSVVALANALKALKPDPFQVLVSLIGPGDCAPNEAHAPRLESFVNEFGANGVILGLCSGQWPVVFDRVFFSYGEDFGPPCLRQVRDLDLDLPGLQPACVAESHVLAPDHSIVNAPLPFCDDGPPPCLRLDPGGGQCTGYYLTIQGSLDWCEADGAMNFTVECLGCADANDPACAQAR